MRRRDFDQLVTQALEKIPRVFRDALNDVQIVVDDWPDPDLMGEVTGDPDEVLYGLFTGKPLTARHFDDWGDLPPVIHIYRGPLEQDFPEPEDLAHEVEVTVAHEIAHYLGFDEETLKDYGYD
jgi:predicted Zn-dependent protease with MMP-like domain